MRSDTPSWSGLARHIRVGERESRGGQPEQVTLQPGEGEGEVAYRKRNVFYLSFKARDTGRHSSHPRMILSSKKPDATIEFKKMSTSAGPRLINNTPNGGSVLAQGGPLIRPCANLTALYFSHLRNKESFLTTQR